MTVPVIGGGNTPPNTPPDNRLRAAINRLRAAINRMSPERKIKLLKTISIALYIIGFSVCIIGVTLMVVYDLPIMVLILLVGMAMIMIATTCLTKSAKIVNRGQGSLGLLDPAPLRGASAFEVLANLTNYLTEHPPIVTDDIPESYEDIGQSFEAGRPVYEREPVRRRVERLVSDFSGNVTQRLFRLNFPIPMPSATEQNENGTVTKKVFYNGRSVHLAFAQRVITDREYKRWSPFSPDIKLRTAVVNDVNSTGIDGTDMLLKHITDEDSWVRSLPEVAWTPGAFSSGTWTPSRSYQKTLQQSGRLLPWCTMYQFKSPKASDCENDPVKACKIMKIGFKRLLSDCIEKGVHVLQIPVLGCSESELPSSSSKKGPWIRAVLVALMDAVNEIDSPSASMDDWRRKYGRRCSAGIYIDIVDSKGMPFANILNEND